MRVRPLTVIPHGDQVLSGEFSRDHRFNTWRIHGTDDWLLILTIAGGGRFGDEAAGFTAVAGDAILLRPGTRHDYGSRAEGWAILWAHFHAHDDWLDLLDWPEAMPGVMRLQLAEGETRRRVVEALRATHRQASGADARRQRWAMNALETTLLGCAGALPEEPGQGLDPRVRQAMATICARLDEAVGPSELARAAGLSLSRFSHLFSAGSGMSVLAWRERQRLRRACQLLIATDASIATVAAQVGFPDQLYFSTRFRRFAGASPSEYRRRR